MVGSNVLPQTLSFIALPRGRASQATRTNGEREAAMPGVAESAATLSGSGLSSAAVDADDEEAWRVLHNYGYYAT